MKPRVFLKSASTDASSNSGVFDDDPDAPAETPDPTDPPTVAPGLVQFFTKKHSRVIQNIEYDIHDN